MLSIIRRHLLIRKTYTRYQRLGLKIDISREKYEIGLIGGNYGYEVLMPELKAMDNVNLTFAAPDNMSLEKKENLAKAGINVLSKSEFFDYEKTKIVFIAVPPSSQLQIGKKVLQNKRDLYIEKPAGLNYIETSKIEEIRKAENQRAFVGFQFRFDPGIIALKELLELKILGNIDQITVNWHTGGTSAKQDNLNWRHNIKLGGGVHRDFLCHVLDYLKWVTNNSINQSLHLLSLDPKIKSNLYNLSLISDQSKNNFVRINISRGFQSVSHWEVAMKFENGEYSIYSSFPFSVNDYRVQISGSKEFCNLATKFTDSNKYLDDSLKLGFARNYALNNYFTSIIKNVFEDNSIKLPDLEDAKFTQLISDQIQKQLTLG